MIRKDMKEMQQNVPEMGKRIWHIVRVVFFMIRKGISKRKLMLELNLIMKRGGKIAGKAIGNLLTLHHHNNHNNHDHGGIHLPIVLTDYEFSCSNSPSSAGGSPTFKSFPFFFNPNNNKRRSLSHSHFFSCVHSPPTAADNDEFMTVNAVKKVLQMLNGAEASAASPGFRFGQSPAIAESPGFGFAQSPAIGGNGRQLRITDSPFPLGDVGGDCHVDDAAEEFIRRFYKELKLQNKSE